MTVRQWIVTCVVSGVLVVVVAVRLMNPSAPSRGDCDRAVFMHVNEGIAYDETLCDEYGSAYLDENLSTHTHP